MSDLFIFVFQRLLRCNRTDLVYSTNTNMVKKWFLKVEPLSRLVHCYPALSTPLCFFL